MSLGFLESVSIGSAVAAGLMAQVTPDPGTVAEFGKWPVTIALIALSAFSIWMAFRDSSKNRETLDKMSENFGKLASELHERPCVRDPKND